MPRKDEIHEAVKNALVKDGWTITADPYVITYRRSQPLLLLIVDTREHEVVKWIE